MMKRLFPFLAVLTAFGLVCNLSSVAGDKKDDKPGGFPEIPKPGPEHKQLAKLTGTFKVKAKMFDGKGGVAESTGTMKRTMILDGRYLKEDFTGELLGMKFKGMGMVGYDVQKKKYVAIWVDNVSTGIASSEGVFDESTKTLTSRGEETMKGKNVKTKDVLIIVSPDEQHMELYREFAGKEFKIMEITLTREKGGKKKKEK